MMPRKENIIKVKTENFSVRIIRMYQYLTVTHKEHTISKQILRSGTSIGANVSESGNAQSTNDFVSKLSIALKEAEETAYWLKCLYAGRYLTEKQYFSMNSDLSEVIRILVKIVKTTKEKNGMQRK